MEEGIKTEGYVVSFTNEDENYSLKLQLKEKESGKEHEVVVSLTDLPAGTNIMESIIKGLGIAVSRDDYAALWGEVLTSIQKKSNEDEVFSAQLKAKAKDIVINTKEVIIDFTGGRLILDKRLLLGELGVLANFNLLQREVVTEEKKDGVPSKKGIVFNTFVFGDPYSLEVSVTGLAKYFEISSLLDTALRSVSQELDKRAAQRLPKDEESVKPEGPKLV